MKVQRIVLFTIVLQLSSSLSAQDFQFYPNAAYDDKIPTLKQIVGHSWAEKVTSHSEMQSYVKALAEASPRIELREYGETWERRTLYYLIVGSESNIARLDEIQASIKKLADPRDVDNEEASRLIQTLPSIVWLAYGVHGNEISSTDAALLTAYHLVAAQNDTLVQQVLQNALVLIDPLQNPDGRDRFVNYFRRTRGEWPDEDPSAAEHNEAWPGGRTNHYLFDLNRDWFPQTQKESRGKVKAYLEWYPQVYVDLHEMGSNSTYYFPPTPLPLNPNVTKAQVNWLDTFGRNNARWFDRMQFDYFTREVFDAFYPGYGVSWPTLQGAMGATYEQASSRGLLIKRSDETTLQYRDAVQHHFISSLSTAETAARNREALLHYFYDYRLGAVREGQREQIKEFIFPPGRDPGRTARLVTKLRAQGVEVKRATSSFSNSKVRDYYNGRLESKQFPTATYIVPMAQPAKHLVKALLAKETPMDKPFVEEQLRRYEKRLNDQIYDITAWSLPLLYDVECYRAEVLSRGQFELVRAGGEASSNPALPAAHLAYIIPWGHNSSARALAQLLRQDVKVFSSDKAFKLNGTTFPRGSLIVKVKDNGDNLHELVSKIAESTGVVVHSTNSSWVEEGVNFGSRQVRFLEKPKIALAYQLPVHPYSVGWTRYLLEQEYDYPVTLVNSWQLGSADLSKYNVLILPHTGNWLEGGYSRVLGESGTRRLRAWIQNGGTLITFNSATRWLTDEKVGLLATSREFKGGKPEREKKPEEESKATKPQDPSKPFDVKKATQPEDELPGRISGAILRVTLDTEHWLAFGYDGETNALVASRNIFTPIKLDKGRNVGLYKAEDELLVSGFAWEDSRKQIANKAFLIHQPHGRGHVVAFAEDPNFRAFCDGLNLLFLNAVFLGPGH